jgi:hypothetical protein
VCQRVVQDYVIKQYVDQTCMHVTSVRVLLVVAGLLSSESDFAPPVVRSRPGAHTTSSTMTPCYVPVTMDSNELGGAGKRAPLVNGHSTRPGSTAYSRIEILAAIHIPACSCECETVLHIVDCLTSLATLFIVSNGMT